MVLGKGIGNFEICFQSNFCKRNIRHSVQLFAINQPFSIDKWQSTDGFVNFLDVLGWAGDERGSRVNDRLASAVASSNFGVHSWDCDAVHGHLPVGLSGDRMPVEISNKNTNFEA